MKVLQKYRDLYRPRSTNNACASSMTARITANGPSISSGHRVEVSIRTSLRSGLQAIKTVSRSVSNGDGGQTSWALNVRLRTFELLPLPPRPINGSRIGRVQAIAEAARIARVLVCPSACSEL